MLYKAPCRVGESAWIRKPPMTATIGLVSLILINIGSSNHLLYAEQKITILPDAHSNTAVRFVDVTNYFIQVAEELTWFNDDFVEKVAGLNRVDVQLAWTPSHIILNSK